MITNYLLPFFLLIVILTPKAEGNTLRGLTAVPPCAVQNFVLFEFGTDGSAQEQSYPTFSLDLTDFNFGTFNIVAQVTEGCKPRCVKLSLAGYERKELVSPFALYGDFKGKLHQGAPRRSGKQAIKACLYTDRACTMGKHGCLSREVDIIPANEPLKAGPFVVEPFSVTFNGVKKERVSKEETKVAAQTLCQVITEFWGYGAFYKSDVGVINFECVGVSKHTSSATIEFNTVASVRKSIYPNPYTNRRLPDSDELFELMTDVLQNNNSIGPNGPGSRDYFVELLVSNNPYSAVTSFTVAM